jgi:serine/threonine protein kinase
MDKGPVSLRPAPKSREAQVKETFVSTAPFAKFHEGSSELHANAIVAGRYQLGRVLGEGAIGKVYQATDLLERREVAVKISKDRLPSKIIVQEAEALLRIRHPNIVKVTDAGLLEDKAYVVMELLHGQNLDDFLFKSGPLSWEQTKDIAVQLCSGLQMLHDNGIIHRDIKPSNVFLTEEGIVKVLDYDISEFKLLEEEDDYRRTQGIFWGNPAYASPEQAAGGCEFDRRVDIYAVGTLMYKMLGSVLPFSADNAVSLLMVRLTKDPFPLGERLVDNSVPQEAISIIMRSLAKKADDRFSTMDEMRQAILSV